MISAPPTGGAVRLLCYAFVISILIKKTFVMPAVIVPDLRLRCDAEGGPDFIDMFFFDMRICIDDRFSLHNSVQDDIMNQ